MDGFDNQTGVIVMAATNRPEVLDAALLRPGRFDRQILIDRPDLAGRVAILGVHAKGKPLSDEIDLETVARRTPGFTGADLANVLNEATLLATRRGKTLVGNAELEDAVDKVMAGPERRGSVPTPVEREVVAYHEAGHALVGWALPGADPLHKVTIIPRGQALGYTQALPAEERRLIHRSQLWNQMAMLARGRAAEDLVFGDPTTGASNDLEKATEIARQMVTRFGMTDALGFMRLNDGEQGFLGQTVGGQQSYSDGTATAIDAEIRRLLDNSQQEADTIIEAHHEAWPPNSSNTRPWMPKTSLASSPMCPSGVARRAATVCCAAAQRPSTTKQRHRSASILTPQLGASCDSCRRRRMVWRRLPS